MMYNTLTSATMMERTRFLWMEGTLDLSPPTQEKTTKQMQREKSDKPTPAYLTVALAKAPRFLFWRYQKERQRA